MRHTIVFLLGCIVFIKRGTAVGLTGKGQLNFPELAAKHGHAVEEYDVITEDGYILRLFRIPGFRRLPVLLMHGLIDSSDTWIIRGNTSLAVTLADWGYDVWIGNCRGNRYSRRHIYLDPDADDGFWDFSFHEHGYYDLATIIDTILHLTGVEKLDAVGHSQGATIFYVLSSTRPEYNEKINVLVSLAPVCYLQNVPPPLKTMIQYSPFIHSLATSLGVQEVVKGLTVMNVILKALCLKPFVGYSTCISGGVFPITGYDEEEMEAEIIPLLIEHFPSSTSEKNLHHYAQVGYRREFSHFDYGAEKNLEKYGYPTPPNYELDAVTMRVALFVGENDKVSTVEDVAILKRNLHNVVQHMTIPRRKMNHADFIWGQHMNEYLFPYIFDVLEAYEVEEDNLNLHI